MDVATPGWDLAAIVNDGEATEIGGVSPWGLRWLPIGRITAVDPLCPPRNHEVTVFEVDGVAPRIVFAAAESSNAAWCFFVPTSSESEWMRHTPFGPSARPLSDP